MTRPARALAPLALACLALGACESSPLATDTPEQRLDVRVTNADAPPASTPARVEPAPDQPARTDVVIEAAQSTIPRPQPVTQPAPAANEPPEQWWLMTPDPVPGRIRVVAKGGGATLPEARQAAVDAGREQLTRLRGTPPENLDFEKTQAFPRAGGVYEAFVLISCER